MKRDYPYKSTDTTISEADKQRVFHYMNPAREEIEVHNPDGSKSWGMSQPGKRCDFLFLAPLFAVFVEMKGVDTRKAVEQLYETVQAYRERCVRKRCLAVIAGPNKIPRADFQTQKKRFRKAFRATLVARSKNPLEFPDDFTPEELKGPERGQ